MHFDLDEVLLEEADSKFRAGLGSQAAVRSGCLMIAVWVMVSVAFGFSLWRAFVAPADSLRQASWVECTSALGTFLMVTVALRAWHKRRWGVPAVGIGLAIACAVGANLATGVVQSLLLEATVSLVFLVALDIFIQQVVFPGIQASFENALEELSPSRPRK